MRILNVVETAYRGTLGGKADAALGLSGALREQGADVSVLLRGNAVNYLVRGQEARQQRLDEDLRRLAEKGVVVYAIREDARDRGLDPGRIIAGVEFVSRSDVADLVERFDQILSW